VGPRAFSGKIRWLRADYLTRTEAFYERHGGKTIILARFVPIVRTFAPFVAGVGRMHYGRFLAYNVVGGVIWVTVCVMAGYFFGNLPFVRDNFSLVVLGIIGVSLIPILIEWIRHRRATTA
jgi:membrane-associated protein